MPSNGCQLGSIARDAPLIPTFASTAASAAITPSGYAPIVIARHVWAALNGTTPKSPVLLGLLTDLRFPLYSPAAHNVYYVKLQMEDHRHPARDIVAVGDQNS